MQQKQMQQKQIQRRQSKPPQTRFITQLPEELLASVDARAIQEMTSRTGIVRTALRDYLQRTQHENQAPA